MADVRNQELGMIKSDDETTVTILKGGRYLCEVRNSEDFNEILVCNFRDHTGFSGGTLIKIGEFVNKLEEQRKQQESTEEVNNGRISK